MPYPYRSMYNTMAYVPNVSADMLLFDFGKTKASADMAKSLYKASKIVLTMFENSKRKVLLLFLKKRILIQ